MIRLNKNTQVTRLTDTQTNNESYYGFQSADLCKDGHNLMER